jgi:hypothetical protein
LEEKNVFFVAKATYETNQLSSEEYCLKCSLILNIVCEKKRKIRVRFSNFGVLDKI